jgi:type II secretory pathway pseudopilin PulG
LGYRVFLLADDLAAHMRFTTEIDGFASRPYWQIKDRMQEYDRQVHSHPGGLMTAILMPSLSAAMQKVAIAEARRGAARLGLALYRYRAQHGRFPEKLDDVVPEFIAAVPPDPFDGKPLRLRQTDRGATVYSIGPETTDKREALWFDIDKSQGEIAFTVPAQGPAKK